MDAQRIMASLPLRLRSKPVLCLYQHSSRMHSLADNRAKKAVCGSSLGSFRQEVLSGVGVAPVRGGGGGVGMKLEVRIKPLHSRI
jgi:hypothetical protein